MREEEAPQIADAKGCVFSPVYLPLASCTSVPSPSHLKRSCLATQWLTVKLRGRILQEPFCSYALCFQEYLFIGPGCSVTASCRDSVWGSVRTRPLIVLYPSLACPISEPSDWRRLRTECWSTNGTCIFG